MIHNFLLIAAVNREDHREDQNIVVRVMPREKLRPALQQAEQRVALILDIDLKLREQPAVAGEVSIL
jgi:hypothetical protein